MIKSYFLKESVKLDGDQTDIRSMFPVITSTKQLSEKEIEIKWIWMIWNFYNEIPYKEETIIINRTQENHDDLIIDSFSDFGFKQETVNLFACGVLIKRLLLNKELNPALKYT